MELPERAAFAARERGRDGALKWEAVAFRRRSSHDEHVLVILDPDGEVAP